MPAAKKIIEQHIGEFMEWHAMRKNAIVLNAIKFKLYQIHLQQCLLKKNHLVFPIVSPNESIQRVINCDASKMRVRDERGCH